MFRDVVLVLSFAEELGGFAKNSREVDGNFESYNFCLAEDYLIAMSSEDWDALGVIDQDLINDVAYWLNYDGKIGEERKNIIEKIPQGLIMTDNNRTFIDAIVAEQKVKLVRPFILNGNQDPRLYLTAMVCHNENFIDDGLLNLIHNNCWNSDTYVEILNNIFKEIDNLYSLCSNLDEKKILLMKIKPYIGAIRFPKDYASNPDMVELSKFNSFGWQKKLKNKKQ